MENEITNNKTKVCSIFEPTYRSIMMLPTDEMKLRMFIHLCNYAFDEIEPHFGDTMEECFMASLWEQFRVVFIQAKKRARRNSINGSKGGRPRKNTEYESEEEIADDANFSTDEF